MAGQAGLGAPSWASDPVQQENSGTAANVKATWDWDPKSDADGYQVQYAEGRSDVRNHDPDADC